VNGHRVADGERATAGLLLEPWSIAAAADGTLVIAELGNFRIRAVYPDGIIPTFAGNGQCTRTLQLSGGLARGVEIGYPGRSRSVPREASTT